MQLASEQRVKVPRDVVRGACTLCCWVLACNALPPTEGAKHEAEPATSDAANDGPQARADVAERAPRETVRLRFATWNLSWLGAKPGRGVVARKDTDYARLQKYAAALDADVIAVQEVHGREAVERVFSPDDYALFVSQTGGAQRTGFAIRRTLAAEQLPDFDALATGGLRGGVDVKVEAAGNVLRLLSVHLKSGCFAAELNTPSESCTKLRAQVPPLESWIDARATEGVPFAVMGDFNRRFFEPRAAASADAMWQELDDGEPRGADLWSPTEKEPSRCWTGKHHVFIDHLVFGTELSQHVVRGSFREQLYDKSDAARRKVLSDHCPLRVDLELPVLKQTKPVTPSAPNDAHLPASATSSANALRGSAADRHSPENGADVASAGPRAVKGNIAHGRKLYHSPECPSYNAVVVDESKGERWFHTDADAEAAGFARAGNCPKP